MLFAFAEGKLFETVNVFQILLLWITVDAILYVNGVGK